MAQSAIPAKIVEITKPNVNIRKTAATNGAIVEKAPKGKQYELVSTQGAWYEIKDPITSEVAFVSNTVSVAKAPVALESYIKETGSKNKEFRYAKTSPSEETSYAYSFSLGEGNNKVVNAWLHYQYVNDKGHSRGNDNSYIGELKGWYIVLNKERDIITEEISEMSPIIVYKSVVDDGYYIDGILYKTVQGSTF
ncbi:hypothetical protein D0T87_00840 [Bacteroides sp. 51]|nr:hypothetical protein [Bacteroides sp. 51]